MTAGFDRPAHGRLGGMFASLPGVAHIRRWRNPAGDAPAAVVSAPRPAETPAPVDEQTDWPTWRNPR